MNARSFPFYKRLILLVSLAIFAFGTPFVSDGYFDVSAQQPWWNDSYTAKRNISIQNNVNNTMVTGYPVRLRFDGGTVPTAAELYAASQASIKGNDFRIIYNNGTELSRWIQTFSSSRIDIWFKTQADIGGSASSADNYQLYYDNPDAINPPDDIDDVMPPGKDGNTIGLWHFADGSGSNFIDTSGRGHHGNLVNAHSWGDDPFGPYIEWFGGGDGAAWGEVGSSSDFDLNQMTFEAWVYPISTGATAEQTIIYRPRSSPENCPGYKLAVTDQKVDLQLNCASGRNWDGQVSMDTWSHIAGTFDGSTMRIYRNGSLIRTLSYDQSLHSTSGRALFLGGSPFSQTFRGRVRHVRISNIARSDFTYAANIAAITTAPSLSVGDEIVRDTSPPVCAPLPSGIVSWWPGEGNANDAIGPNHGTLVNGTTFALGEVNQSFSLDGVNDYVQASNEANFDFERTMPVAYAAWVKISPKSTGDSFSHVIVGKQGNGGGIGYQMTAAAGGPGDVRLTFAIVGSGGQDQVLGSTQIADNNWHHVAVTYNGTGVSGMKLYVDGNLEATSVLFDTHGAGGSILNNLPLTIGARGSGDGAAKGLIDEVEIYNRALSASEIEAIFNAGSAGHCHASDDNVSPVVNVSFPPPNGQNGWFINSSVSGTVTVDETATGGGNITAIDCTGATLGTITGLGTPIASASLTVSDEGVNNISCTAMDSAGNSGAGPNSNNVATIQIDTIAPTFDCDIAPATWSASDVSRACNANDNGSGLATPSSFSLTTSVPNGIETNDALTDTTQVCDNAGHCETVGPLDGNMVDKKTPVQIACDTPDGDWHSENVTLNCTYNDGGSGPSVQNVELTTNVPDGTEAADATASANGAQACDNVGNCATSPADIPGNMIDRKVPSFNCGSADANWYAEDQSVTCSATDDASGLANPIFALSTNVPAGNETDNAFTDFVPVCDAVYNCVTAGPIGPFRIDKRGPNVVCIATPTYLLNQSDATVSATVTDGGSGHALSPVSIPVLTSTVGSHTGSITGFDNVGNSTTTSCPYNVTYNFSNFLPPVDSLPTLNEVKAGASVPVKFSLNGNMGLNIFETGYPKSQQIACESTAPVDGIEETVTSGASGLSYDPSTDTYTYVWKTNKAWAGTCRQLVLKLNDGNFNRANFKFK